MQILVLLRTRIYSFDRLDRVRGQRKFKVGFITLDSLIADEVGQTH